MKSGRKRQTLDRPLMAQAVADAVGATKRRVQLWSDHGVLQFLPGSGGVRGNQRLYPRTELPFAAMACYLAKLGVNIGTIDLAVFMARTELNPPTFHGADPSKYRRYLRGEIDSYILVRTHPKNGGGYDQSVTWIAESELMEYLKGDCAATVINVKKVMSPHAE